jgi:hypothetical protein
MPLNSGHRHELIAVFISLFDFLPDLIFPVHPLLQTGANDWACLMTRVIAAMRAVA